MITSQLLTISSEQNKNDSVIITATMLPTRDYHMKDMVQIKGELQEGYEMVGEPVFSTEFITIAASEENLNMLEEMPAEQRADAILESRIVDISDLTETTVFKIKVKELDINKDKWVTKKPESGTTVRVTIEVAPVQEETTGNEEIQTENAQAEDVQNGDQQE